jgi:hypothetical protein
MDDDFGWMRRDEMGRGDKKQHGAVKKKANKTFAASLYSSIDVSIRLNKPDITTFFFWERRRK